MPFAVVVCRWKMPWPVSVMRAPSTGLLAAATRARIVLCLPTVSVRGVTASRLHSVGQVGEPGPPCRSRVSRLSYESELIVFGAACTAAGWAHCAVALDTSTASACL